MRWFDVFGLCVAGLCMASSASAAEPAKKMYRCGNVFQERPCEGPKAEPAAKAEPAKQGPSQSTLEQRQKIRCENYGRQLSELMERSDKEQNADLKKGLLNQRVTLESRMKTDGC